MNTTTQISGALRSAFERPTGGVVGLVDDLLKLCPERGLQLEWQAERCRVRPVSEGSEEVLNWPLRKSIFRAILARVATLCNEQSTNSVSPYGGQAELVVDTDPPAIFRVTITNTADEQKLELIPLPACLEFKQCMWKELQKLVGRLEQACSGELRSAVDSLKLEPSFIRIVLKVVTRALGDRDLWNLIRQLLVIQPSGKRVAAVYGDMHEVRRILQCHVEHGDDDLCLIQLENYAAQIVACYLRETIEAKGASSQNAPPREDDIW